MLKIFLRNTTLRTPRHLRIQSIFSGISTDTFSRMYFCIVRTSQFVLPDSSPFFPPSILIAVLRFIV